MRLATARGLFTALEVAPALSARPRSRQSSGTSRSSTRTPPCIREQGRYNQRRDATVLSHPECTIKERVWGHPNQKKKKQPPTWDQGDTLRGRKSLQSSAICARGRREAPRSAARREETRFSSRQTGILLAGLGRAQHSVLHEIRNAKKE